MTHARQLPDAAGSATATTASGDVRIGATGWALIQIGLALVTSSARHQHAAATSPELP